MDNFLDFHALLTIAGILAVAGMAHGAIGFGFPMLSTPIVAMMTDVKTAVLITVIPNLAINVISVLRGGNWRHSIAKYWPIAIYVLIGTLIGTHVLFMLDAEPLKLFLAAIIVLYLQQNKIRQFDWTMIKRNPNKAAVYFGLLGGFLSGTVNVTVPPLVIYFAALGLESVAMTQILNFCFLVGKSTQAATLLSSGTFSSPFLAQSAQLTVISCAGLMLGIHLQRKIRPETYQAILRKLLWLMAIVLAAQVAWHYLH
ncbi:MAG: putative permease [Herminiimonas sp.]|nr:putative permease [Herminiimonas sp.]